MDAGILGRVSRCHAPLRLIFWGGLLCLFDFSFSTHSNGRGFKFDVLNDFVGMILITVGVFRIVSLELVARRGWMFVFAGVVSVFSSLAALVDHFIFPREDFFFWIATFLALAELAAILFFCLGMRAVCVNAGLEGPAKSWRTTYLVFLIIFVIPLGLLQASMLAAAITGSSFSINLGVEAIVMVFVFFIPFVHFFVSTSRMIRAVRPAERMALES